MENGGLQSIYSECRTEFKIKGHFFLILDVWHLVNRQDHTRVTEIVGSKLLGEAY